MDFEDKFSQICQFDNTLKHKNLNIFEIFSFSQTFEQKMTSIKVQFRLMTQICFLKLESPCSKLPNISY